MEPTEKLNSYLEKLTLLTQQNKIVWRTGHELYVIVNTHDVIAATTRNEINIFLGENYIELGTVFKLKKYEFEEESLEFEELKFSIDNQSEFILKHNEFDTFLLGL